jgi:hypothetical protein
VGTPSPPAAFDEASSFEAVQTPLAGRCFAAGVISVLQLDSRVIEGTTRMNDSEWTDVETTQFSNAMLGARTCDGCGAGRMVEPRAFSWVCGGCRKVHYPRGRSAAARALEQLYKAPWN